MRLSFFKRESHKFVNFKIKKCQQCHVTSQLVNNDFFRKPYIRTAFQIDIIYDKQDKLDAN
jgi:hypothetical protein